MWPSVPLIQSDSSILWSSISLDSDVFRPFDWAWVPNLWPQKNTFQAFFLQLYFSKKYIEVAINDLTVHLIIAKWLRVQEYKQKRKTVRQRGRSERRNCQRNRFHSFSYALDHASIRVFFYVNSLHCFVWFHSYYFLHLLSSYRFSRLSQAYSHTNFLFEYINFLIIIHEKEFFVM